MAKVNISINDDLLSRISDYAERNYLSRSAFFSLASKDFLDQKDIIQAVLRLDVAIQKIADTGQIDEKTQKELDDFKRLSVILTGMDK